MNSIVVSGNLTADATTKEVNGRTVVNFTVADNHHFTNANGEKQQDTTFLNCEQWFKSTPKVAALLTKGKALTVQGRMTIQSWEKDGNKQSRPVIRVNQIELQGK